MCYYSVHTPIEAKQEKIGKYKKKAEAMGLDKIRTFEEGELFPWVGNSSNEGPRVVRRLVQSDPAYAAMIESLDENIGRLLNAVDDAGKTEETIVFFTSDNGGLATSEGSPTCNAPLAEGKGWMYEGGTREPLIVKWPGVVEAGSRCDTPVTSPDFYPTMLEMAGLPLIPEQHCDGVSIMLLLKGSGVLEREAIFWHYPHYGNQGGTPGSSVRSGDYKLIEFFEDGSLELYDLRNDPGEDNSLIGAEQAVAERLHKTLVKWREDVEAKIPQRNPDFEGP